MGHIITKEVENVLVEEKVLEHIIIIKNTLVHVEYNQEVEKVHVEENVLEHIIIIKNILVVVQIM
jgi:hypothetical protein